MTINPNKKKIGIFTICDALNYGAFYQMFGLYKYFEQQGHEVYIFSFPESASRKIIKYFSFNPIRQYRKSKLRFNFHKDESQLNIKKYNGEFLDIAVLGSDELWNIQNNSFTSHDAYFGIGINADSVISYAPSIGFCDPNIILDNPKIRKALSKLDCFSARDIATREMLMKVTNCNVELVGDPTILYNDWRKHIRNFKSSEKYLLYYGYDSNPPFKTDLLKFAKQNSFKIYSSGFNTHDWCDKNLLLSPLEFLGLLINSHGFFTSTFHGTVMASLLNVPFVSFSKGQKVIDFINRFDLNERFWHKDKKNIVEILSCKDFNKTNEQLNHFMNLSRKFIKKSASNNNIKDV